ncbi:polygalacturonase ADPG1-like [Salvia miltiorrhiza]|uniref:polygalacturonase ADPG1-like n=1 Tax=Salvia miltiorrhiza TaxID=226208 RepID=UPI0025ACD898|nr:polygalacturonase ADPG1-like [Salvia miltiorrhiza]
MFVVLSLVLASSSSPYLAWASDEASYFNVTDYGAIGDGRTENSQAFLKVWNVACKASVKSPTIYVPRNKTFLVNPIIFHGPCTALTINFLILGTIVAPDTPKSWDAKNASEWLAVMNTNGLTVDGFGVIDGQGKAWWDQSCKYHPQLKNCTTLAPTAWKFIKCNNSSVRNMRFINSAQTHILITGCDGFVIQNVEIASPGNSPNTDGIHIQASHHLNITHSNITNGDDCISIGDHTSDLSISNIQCTLGHGISIGSLGRGGSLVQVENINVTDCIFNQTSNGARIKTWQVGTGYLKHVAFERLTFNNVKNPIIIDQNYCNVSGACPELKTGVQISNVSYRHAMGTSATEIAINFNCSKSVPCHAIAIESVKLTSAIAGKRVTANCSNAYGKEHEIVPGPCLLHETQSKTP